MRIKKNTTKHVGKKLFLISEERLDIKDTTWGIKLALGFFFGLTSTSVAPNLDPFTDLREPFNGFQSLIAFFFSKRVFFPHRKLNKFSYFCFSSRCAVQCVTMVSETINKLTPIHILLTM